MQQDPIEFSEQLVRTAGEILRDYYQKESLQTGFKTDQTVITDADLAVDRFIRSEISRNFPQDELLTEESYNWHSDSQKYNLEKAVWIIDPIDGSTNFSLGMPIWGILCTRLLKGEPQITAMYFPVIDELYTAQAGNGARLNGKTIHVDDISKKDGRSFFACCSRTPRYYEVSLPYKVRIIGSTAYTFCQVAHGAALIGFDATPKIWDIAGAWLLVREAGGIIEPFHENSPFPLRCEVDYSQQNYPIIATATNSLMVKARKGIKLKQV